VTRVTEPLGEALVAVHRMLGERRETVAVAESLTGGLLSAALTETPGASATFRGALVVYATGLKSTLAGVPEALVARRGAVDPAVAEAMARGVRDRLEASWGIGVTGVAGPEPQDGHPIGTVFVAVCGPGLEFGIESVSQLDLRGDRNTIRMLSVEHSVSLLHAALRRRVEDESGL
jgi:nicotinamide-nucleotide amidase